MEGVIAREHLPSWDRLWDDLVQEETRRGYEHRSLSTGNSSEKDVAFTAKGKKKSKKGTKGGANQKGEQKRDMRKVHALLAKRWGTMLYSVQPRRRRNKLQLSLKMMSLLLDSRRSFHC